MREINKEQTDAIARMGTETSKTEETKDIVIKQEEPDEVQESDEEQTESKRLKLEQEDASTDSIVKAENSSPPNDSNSSTALVINGTHPTSQDLTVDIDTRLAYRQGWPLLPVLPVKTSREQVPKALSKDSLHFSTFQCILSVHDVSVHELEIAHRFNAGIPIGKTTLTLCVQSDISCSEYWESAIRGLRSYIQEEGLTLAVEIIDHRVFNGVYTLPILSYDPLTAFIAKRRHGIVKALNEYGEEWASLEFFYRGLAPKRDECKATVLVGVPKPNRAVWWEKVLPKMKEKVTGKLEVEICWREVVKY